MFGVDSEADALCFPPSRIGIKTAECYVPHIRKQSQKGLKAR